MATWHETQTAPRPQATLHTKRRAAAVFPAFSAGMLPRLNLWPAMLKATTVLLLSRRPRDSRWAAAAMERPWSMQGLKAKGCCYRRALEPMWAPPMTAPVRSSSSALPASVAILRVAILRVAILRVAIPSAASLQLVG